MFQRFLRANPSDLRKKRLAGEQQFRARSATRDADADRSRVRAIIEAVDRALQEAESEQAGLKRRIEDVLARAAVTLGNGNDEYLERETLDNLHQDLFDSELLNGQRRLGELGSSITHFKFLKAAVLSRFPEYAPSTGSAHRLP